MLAAFISHVIFKYTKYKPKGYLISLLVYWVASAIAGALFLAVMLAIK